MLMNAAVLVVLTIGRALLAPPGGQDHYLDPGSGSYLLQLLIASLLGGAFLLRTFWSRIVGFFKREDETTAEDEDEPA